MRNGSIEAVHDMQVMGPGLRPVLPGVTARVGTDVSPRPVRRWTVLSPGFNTTVEPILRSDDSIAEIAAFDRAGQTVFSSRDTGLPLFTEVWRSSLEDDARFEIPRYFRFTQEALPRTASGKILKRQLREEAAEHLAGANG